MNKILTQVRDLTDSHIFSCTTDTKVERFLFSHFPFCDPSDPTALMLLNNFPCAIQTIAMIAI